jgi:TolA-binding protein
MSHSSSESLRTRPGRSSRPPRGPTQPPRRSRIRAIGSALLVTVACSAVATVPYFVFRDDFFARVIGRTQAQAQISYEDQIADLRAQIDRMSQLNQARVEEIKSLLQRQVTLENVTSGLAKDLSIQARNGLPASGTIDSAPVLSPIETRSANPRVESAKQAEQAITSDDKKVSLPHRKQARVVRKRTQEAPTVAADHNASVPAVQQNY